MPTQAHTFAFSREQELVTTATGLTVFVRWQLNTGIADADQFYCWYVDPQNVEHGRWYNQNELTTA